MTVSITSEANQYIATISGRLDTAAAPKFQQDIQPLIEHADKNITLDCSSMEFISSSGLRIFLTIRKASMAKGGKVIIKGLSDEVKNVFTITGFNSLFEFE